MRVIVTGLPYFGKLLVKDLKEMDPENKYVFLDTYYSKRDQLKFVFKVRKADVVVSFNGAYSPSKSLDLAMKFKKPVLMQWHGTDVLNTLEQFDKGILFRKYIDYATHFSDSEALIEELEKVNIEVGLLHFKHFKTDVTVPQKELQVTSYIASGREEFYGIKKLKVLAEQFPEIPFYIIGTKAKGFDLPSNCKMLGWVEKDRVEELIGRSAVFLRLTDHDGHALSVLEALVRECHVIWSQKNKYCLHYNTEEELLNQFSQLISAFRSGEVQNNREAKDRVLKEFQKEEVIRKYIDAIKGVARK